MGPEAVPFNVDDWGNEAHDFTFSNARSEERGGRGAKGTGELLVAEGPSNLSHRNYEILASRGQAMTMVSCTRATSHCRAER